MKKEYAWSNMSEVGITIKQLLESNGNISFWICKNGTPIIEVDEITRKNIIVSMED